MVGQINPKKLAKIALFHAFHWAIIFWLLCLNLFAILVGVNRFGLLGGILLITLIVFPTIMSLVLFLHLYIARPLNVKIYSIWEAIVWTTSIWATYIAGISTIHMSGSFSNIIKIIIFILLSLTSFIFYFYQINTAWPNRYRQWRILDYLIDRSILDEENATYDVSNLWDWTLINTKKKQKYFWNKNPSLWFLLSIIVVSFLHNQFIFPKILDSYEDLFGISMVFLLVVGAAKTITGKWFKYQIIKKWEEENGKTLTIG